MIKLLLLALLGLGLGGGVWKAQNPDGTLTDLKAQSMATVERLKTGVDAVISHPETLAEEAAVDARLAALEQQLENDDQDAELQRLTAMIDEQRAITEAAVSNLQASLDQQAAPIEATTATVAELDSALQDTRALTDAGNVRLDTFDQRLDLMVNRLDEQTEQTDLASKSLETLQSQLGDVQSELSDRNNSVDEALARVNEQTGTLGLRLNTLASTGTSDSPSEAQATLSASVDERLSGIEQRLATVNTDSRRVEAMTEQLSAANNKIAELELQNNEARQSIEELNSSVEILNTVSESISIDSIQAQISDQLALAQSQFDSSAENSDNEQLKALLDVTRNRIQTLEQRVQDLPASSNEADDAQQIQSSLQTQIAELEQRLEALTGSEPAQASVVTREDLTEQEKPEAVEYKIYFNRNSTDITEDAARVLNSFITQEKNRTTGVSIFGFTDRSGSAAYNQELALQRATNVRSYLIQNGLDFTKIKALTGLGEDAAAAVLPDEAADAQQRVVVLYADQP